MPRYIDADAYESKIHEAQTYLESDNDRIWSMNKPYYKGLCFARRLLIDSQTADVQEVKHGKFVKRYDEFGIDRGWMCSNCRNSVYSMTFEPYSFCPHCGAKMDGEES